MPSIPLYPPSQTPNTPTSLTNPTNKTNPLPTLLQTPSGLALLEIQGTIHSSGISLSTPSSDSYSDSYSAQPDTESQQSKTTEIGRLVFPDYNPSNNIDDKKWMKKVYLFIGKHQRMGGEVRELRNAIAVVRRREKSRTLSGDGDAGDELEIAEIVRYKVVFANRPEPVGTEEVVAQS